jgi:GT2 family glycosyltransferase
MLALLKSDARYGVVGPVLGRQGPKTPEVNAPPVQEVEWASGACLVLRRSAVKGIFFDEQFGSYIEDIDFCLRVSDAGYKIGRAKRAMAWDLGSISPTAGERCEVNHVRLMAKRGGWKGALAAAAVLLLNCVRFGLASLAVWRPRDRRRASRLSFRDHSRAVVALVGHGQWPWHVLNNRRIPAAD